MSMSFSTLPVNASAIPPKTRTVPKSPLFQKLESIKVGEGFIINDVNMEDVSANVYATAKRVGVKVTLRQLDEGVGVWRLRNPRTTTAVNEADDVEEAAPTAPARGRRTMKIADAEQAAPARGRRTLVKASKNAGRRVSK